MTYYLDNDFILHIQNNGTMTPWMDEEGFFDNKCQTFIEGYRVVPEGMSWIRKDGEVFSGLMICPHIDPNELLAAQKGYEEAEAIIAELDAALLDSAY